MDALLKIAFIAIVFLSGCGIPKDPDETFIKAKSNQLKVGIVDNPPFTVISGDKYSGIEVDLVRDFATRNNLKIEFIEASESELIKRLEDRQIHIFIGGFDKKTIWKDKAGATIAYDEEHIILVPRGENRLVFEIESIIHKLSES